MNALEDKISSPTKVLPSSADGLGSPDVAMMMEQQIPPWLQHHLP